MPLCPPKPKLFDSDARAPSRRATLDDVDRREFGDRVGEARRGRHLAVLHGEQHRHRLSAPAAPSAWPVMPLVEVTNGPESSVPNTLATASASAASFLSVDVPCALMCLT